MLRKLWQIPLFAWLVAVFPIASIAARNPGQAEGVWVAAVLGVAVIAATALGIGYRLVSGSWHRAGLAVLATVLVFYAYGPAGGLVEAYLLDIPDGTDVGFFAEHASSILSAVWVVLLTGAVAASLRISEDLARRAAGPLNTIASLLVGFAVVQALAAPPSVAPDSAQSVAARPAPAAVGESPDIYVIMLDGYARGDVLSTLYGFDNSEFLGELNDLGFTVVNGGNANYVWTHLSLSSSLNMNYLPEVLEGPILAGSRSRAQTYDAIRDNAAARFLRHRGYEFVQLQSSWGGTRTNPHADVFLPCSTSVFTNEFVRAVVEASWLRAIDEGESLAQCHLTNFETLAGLGSRAGPKFVFAHFVLPHHPYLFDSSGTVLSDATIANQFDFQARLWEDKASYVAQLGFVNRAVVAAIAKILETSALPPVVLIHSDHGPNLVNGLSADEQLRVRFANFAAVHAPGVEGRLIPDGETPVNYFRRIFNEYFDAGLPILESRQFASEYRTPYKLSDVTSVAETTRISLEGP
jgi:hypothetical protein